MWLKKKNPYKETDAPEKLRYSRYYEHDGALRAYANRSMVLAFLSVPTAMIAVGLAAYVRLQPPTLIRVDATGALPPTSQRAQPQGWAQVRLQNGSDEPNDFEKKACVRL